MGFGIRVTFAPTLRTKANGGLDVPGATVGFERFGEPPSEAERDSAKPATLVFFGAYIEKVRESVPEFKRMATLSGEVELRGAPPEIVFVLDPEGDFEYDEPKPEKGEPFRELRMAYDEQQFEGVPEKPDAPLTRLRLPKPPEKARFVELGVELQIAGNTEAAREENHQLDVPLRFPIQEPLFWITEPPASTAGQPALVLFDEGGTEVERVPLLAAEPGPGKTRSIDLTKTRGGSARLIELHQGNQALMPLLRLEVDEIRERLAAGIADAIREVLRPQKEGDLGGPLDGAEEFPDPEQAQDPPLPPPAEI